MPRHTEWPPVTFERLTWLIEQGGDARRSGRGRRYDSAVVPEISNAEMMLPSECALVSEDVRTAIAAFDLRVGDVLGAAGVVAGADRVVGVVTHRERCRARPRPPDGGDR